MALHDNLKAGERRTATILFSDMKGFTSLSERMDPEEMDVLMGRIFGLFEEIIRARGGMVEKYIGDALVAVFGVPELHEDDAARAIDAALDFRCRVAETLRATGRDLSFRTGIHTGLVTTGRRGEFDVVTGHAMSVAQRLEAAAAPDTILVSEATRERCELEYEFSEPLEILAKGKSEVIRAYTVKGAATGELNDAGPFIGRRDELDAILKAYMRNRYDEVSGFYISGEAGIGKTRLAQAFVDKIRLFPDFRTPVLAARAHGNRPGFLAVIVDILLDYLLLPPTAAREEIEAALAKIEGIDADTRSRFAGLCCPTDEDGADPRTTAVLYKIFTTVIERHSQDLFPLLVVLDNAPAMDSFSLAFFRYWVKNGRIKPFFVLTGRDFPSELRKIFQGLTLLKLGPLEGEAAADLARAWCPDVEEGALEKVLEASLGNPLFIREYALWARRHRDVSSLPASVQNIFLAALERYPGPRRDLAKKLSVFVHSFTLRDAQAVEEATGGDPGGAEASLEAFASDGLLVSDGKGSWSFRLDVFKKALYASLLNHNKRILHGHVADILLAQESPNKPRLIHHLLRADRDLEAARIIQNDRGRVHNFEYLPLIEILSRRVAADESASFALLVTKAALLFNRGRLEESEAVLKRILRTALAKKSDLLLGYAYHHIAAYSAISFSFQKAVFTGRKALAYYAKAGATPESAQSVLRNMVQAEAQRAELDEARRLVAQCEAVEGGSPHAVAEAKADYYILTGDYRRALAVLDASIAGMPADRLASRFYAFDLRLKALWQLCDFAGVERAARDLITISLHSESAQSQANAMLAVVSFRQGDLEASRDSFVQAEILAGQVQNDFEKLDAMRTLALCRHLTGEARKAEDTANEALTVGLRHSAFWPTFTLLLVLVESSLARGKTERARFYLAEASHLFAAGFLLPAKDMILYYWFASRLLGPEDSERHAAVAFRLLAVEKARIGDPALIANFLSTRSFGAIAAAAGAAGSAAQGEVAS